MSCPRLWHRLRLAVLLALLAAQGARAEQALQVVTEEWAPFNYPDKGVAKGSATEVVRAVLERAGFSYSIAFFTWGRAYHIATTQPNVLIYTIERLPNREALFKWVRPLGGSHGFVLFRLRSQPAPAPATPEEAKRYRIGCASLDGAECTTLRFFGFKRLEVPPTMPAMVKMFFAHRFDLLLAEPAALASEMHRQGHGDAEVVPLFELFRADPYMALSLATPDETVHKLQNAFDSLQREGRIRPIR